MGWTYTDIARFNISLDQAKFDHINQATRYGDNIKANIVIHEWKACTWFAVIRLEYLEGHEKAGQVCYFLRTDMIEASPSQFGYKDMTEEMGPYVQDKPSLNMIRAIFKYIPKAEGYAKEFRQRMGIPYLEERQLELI